MTKTAFVTGATGFLGLNLIEELSHQNWKIIAFHLPGVDLRYLTRFEVQKQEGDLTNMASLVQAIPENVDVIFHTAGNTSMWAKNDHQQYLDNVTGTQNLVSASLEKKAKRLIYTSSIAAYGYHNFPVDENTISNALKCNMNYNKTKYMAEQIVKEAVINKGLQAVILNPVNIIGPYDIHNWTKQFFVPVYQNNLPAIPPGKAMWCHVKDVVNAHIRAENNGKVGENYLLGGVDASFKEVVNEIERQLGKKQSHSVQPQYLLKIISLLLELKSGFDGKEPILTFAKYKRAVGHISCRYDKAVLALDYHTSSLEKMVSDSFEWLKKEALLTDHSN